MAPAAPAPAAPAPLAATAGARFLAVLAAVTLGLLIATAWLPFSPRIAWQATAGSEMFHTRWIYERLHDDRAPIDVAVLGSSRVEAGISPVVLGAQLSARLGRPVHVANLALVRPGRDLAFVTVRDLLATHPEVRVIVLSDDGYATISHPVFREVASPADLLRAPKLYNSAWAASLLYLPWRNLKNLAEQAFPRAFGVAPAFDRAAYLGSDLDRTLGYRLADGRLVNGNQTRPAAQMWAFAARSAAARHRSLGRLPLLPPTIGRAIDVAYTARIAALARAHGVRIAFLRIPFCGPVQPQAAPGAYRAIGPDFSLMALAAAPALFQNGAHLNRAGAERASLMAADLLAPLVAQAMPRRPAAAPRR